MDEVTRSTLEKLLSGSRSVTISMAELCNLGPAKPEQKIRVRITDLAQLKMTALVTNCAKEIAWHGIVKYIDGEYVIQDILMYPQVITGATVNATEDYDMWLDSLDDDTFNHIRMQGHSHVYMGIEPSPVDLDFYDTLVKHIKNYYIFIIMNKSGQMFINFFDIHNNIVYEKTDIDIVYDTPKFDTRAWYDKVFDEYVEEHSTRSVSGYAGYNNTFFDEDGTVATYAKNKKAGKR